MSEPGRWALVLGASSGFGAATALELARAGHDVLGVHLDRKATLPQAEELARFIREQGREAHLFNVNAADDDRRREVLDRIAAILAERGGGRIAVLFHSLAFGTLKNAVGPDCLTRSQLEMTLDVMAHSLLYWTQDLVARDLFARGAHVLAMTSEGAEVVWKGYGAVSAAKAALEAHVRQLAVELAPRGIAVNALRAGVADTPAARKIPAFDELQALCKKRNPHGRLTTPLDVARWVAAVARPETCWMTGNVIGVDGGERAAG
ncbi:MAG: SDR family oxidoreductase [Myxococcales bacterium]